MAFVRQAEGAKLPGKTALTEAVARYYFKLLAVKDEYEVARLHSNGDFEARVAREFEGDYKLNFHLAPPLFARKRSGHRRTHEAPVRPVDDEGVSLPRIPQGLCVAVRSTSSRTPTNAARSSS